MSAKAEQVLQKISFIEQDIELHKSILTSIPEGQEAEMERVVGEIVRLKDRIAELKNSLADIDPEVHSQVKKLEKAAETFQKNSAGKEFKEVVTLNQSPECKVKLKDGSTIECLVKARDDDGSWTVLTLDGESKVYSKEEVVAEEE